MILRTAILVMLMLASATTVAIEIHQEKSLYRNIVVREADNRRCLLFTVKRGDRNQTCMDLQDPKRLVLEERNRDSAEKIKSLMFTFEDLQKLDPGGVQTLLRNVNKDKLGTALKGSSEQIKELFF